LEPVKGYLEILDRGFGFLRTLENNFLPGPADTFVPAFMIQKNRLQEGVFIEGTGIKGKPGSQNLKLSGIETINKIPITAWAEVVPFQSQTSINPLERLKMTMGPDDLTGRTLDLIVPMGKGQRGLIISPPKAGKTSLLKHMANALALNHPEVDVYVLLVDERPEEVTDFKRGLKNAHILFSSSDQSVDQHMRMTRLALQAALHWSEVGRDTVVLIDSLTRMARAFNAETRSHGRTLTGGLGATAMVVPRKIFGTARNIENGGSLTIMATILVDTGSRMDDIIFQEFKGTGNMDLVLSRKCAEQRIWPAIHIQKSGTRKEEALLDSDEYQEVLKLRRALAQKDEITAMSQLLEYFLHGR
jgi:transcription termination factor Rho